MSRRAIIKRAKIRRMKKIEFQASIWENKTWQEILEDIASVYPRNFIEIKATPSETQTATMTITTEYANESQIDN